MTRPPQARGKTEGASAEGQKTVRDSLIVTIGGQLERAIGTFTSLALHWGLDAARLGIYGDLRLYLDNTNRSSLGVSLGAVQEIPILRAAGREDEADRLGNIAYTTNTITCLAYALALCVWAWLRRPLLAGNPREAEWTWGLVIIAGLTLIKRYESFLIAVLRAHREFVLTTKLDILESSVSIVLVSLGLWLAGFWGLLGAVGLILLVKIAYLHLRHPLRFRWEWHTPTTVRLMKVGLPILLNTSLFGAVLTFDRTIILWRIPDGETALGLYTIAIMGTSWSLDLAGRIVLVMYTAFQTTLGRTSDIAEVARQAMRATEVQAPILAAGSAIAYVVGPTFLGTLIPRYAEGLPALRPLLPGVVLLGLAWPARQMLITIERPYRLGLATLAGLAVIAAAATLGADRAGIVGVAWGMSIGYAAVALFTSAAAIVPHLGYRTWLRHLGHLGTTLVWFLSATLITAHLPLGGMNRWAELAIRCSILASWGLPTLWVWGSRNDWGGMGGWLARRRSARPVT
ncbi:lipopolysaccharide biosynthesis protein [Singulisphaera sp. PoT]|uniref:lipopolysaccharide biosynthesis protein n=1 Tax=Singulisphaera sp. PoT TaxID=3411797 RepID=UPI003BF5CF3E